MVLIEKCFFFFFFFSNRVVFHRCMKVWERFQKKGGSNREVFFHQCGFHQCGLSSGRSVIGVVCPQDGLSSVVSHRGGLSSGWSAIGVVCHCGGLSPGWSVIWTFFHQDDVI